MKCNHCNNEALPGRKRCLKHGLYDQEYSRRRYEEKGELVRAAMQKKRKEYVANGQCPRCSAPLHPEADRGNIECMNCRMKRGNERPFSMPKTNSLRRYAIIPEGYTVRL